MFDHVFDTVFLSRLQFAFTISFHIIFPAISIGLASFLAVLEYLFLKTGRQVYRDIYGFWIKIFAICFGLGVVSGIVMAYQFGTNWSTFAATTGNVLGPLLGYEVLTAFFLEASFLGIMLFGWGRVSKKMHFASTVIVAIGTLISAFWILSANSWMQTPTGHSIGADGIFYPESWIKIIFNPSFVYRFFHMVLAAYLSTAFIVGAVAAYYLLKKRHLEQAKTMFKMAIGMAVIVAPLQLIIGDLHGLNTLKHQPAKIAAMEGLWEDEKGAGFKLIAKIDEEKQETETLVSIPKAASLILTHDSEGEIKGLKSFPADARPPMKFIFWSFRIMIGLGLLMILLGIWGAIQNFRGKLLESKNLQRFALLMGPSGLLAILSGWMVTEVGRQPFLVQGLLKTADMVSPVPASSVAISLGIFVFSYLIIFGFGTYYIFRLFKKGFHHTDPAQPTDDKNSWHQYI